MNRPHWIPCCSVLSVVLFASQARAAQLVVDTNGGVTDLIIDAQPPYGTWNTAGHRVNGYIVQFFTQAFPHLPGRSGLWGARSAGVA